MRIELSKWDNEKSEYGPSVPLPEDVMVVSTLRSYGVKYPNRHHLDGTVDVIHVYQDTVLICYDKKS